LTELQAGRDLPSIVAGLLTPATTASLPPEWHGVYTRKRAQAWIAERDQESTTLLVIHRDSGEPVGLVILFEIATDDPAGHVDLRIGYLLAESHWGRGFAGEVIEGLVSWCRSHPLISSIAGGVSQENVASARALLRNGFVAAADPQNGEQIYELCLRA
jgi:RimJ/RimL family protein N-acetyltransferase